MLVPARRETTSRGQTNAWGLHIDVTRQGFALGVKLPVFIAAALPGAILAWQLLDGALASPYRTIVRESGLWSLRLLLLGLAITPLRALTGWNDLVKLRRMLGLFAAAYAGVHLLAWARFYAFDWAFLIEETFARLYLVIGLVGAIALIPLSLTSTRAAMRRLGGRAWQRLHSLVHLAAITALVHYVLARRYDRVELAVYAVALAVMLGWRLAARLTPAPRPVGRGP